MTQTCAAKIAAELAVRPQQVDATVGLLDGDATVPFIARYRKEVTGSLDEVAITAIRDRVGQLRELDKRRKAILKSLEERNLLTDALKADVMAAETMAALEDVYIPYKPKRRTRATIAREKGLEPLAMLIYAQQRNTNPFAEAAAFVSAEKGVADQDEALAGARDIIAEWVSENADVRAKLRELYVTKGVFVCRMVEGKEADGAKYRDYFEWDENVATAPSHRVLAMRRGENEGFLTLKTVAPEGEAMFAVEQLVVKGESPAARQVREAAADSLARLLSPSMETEVRQFTKDHADLDAIRVFKENLRQILLAAPLGQRNVLAIDPGYRTGCKLVCLDKQGRMAHNDVVYLQASEAKIKEAADKVKALVKKFKIEAVAIGNGTASRETEAFVRALDLGKDIAIVMVNESGASVYSASDVAREEFPNHDITVRGAVSIGRRLMDPLAELVKIDPKSIGVGQYQHDVDQPALAGGLNDVVVSCVNAVGVEVNTASKQLLTHVSGLGPQLAQNIVDYVGANGPFNSRKELRKVPRLGPKAFEQAAGFLRIRDAANPLDASAVHPESYPIVEAMAKDLGCTVAELMRSPERQATLDLKRYVTPTTGMPTLVDIRAELAKPGRDPRETFEEFKFADVQKPEDLRPGMKLPGIVTNITAFGVFVDVGVHQDGLVHISQLADKYVKNPADVVKVAQKVMVTVVSVDLERRRIALTMRGGGA
ncbi:MAG: RNA-binding transcriptional accessory protein [SAR202 cluster bacterium]|nr:RNA-binding transcriptional accessory protein [SAR202 cluster bacterium]